MINKWLLIGIVTVILPGVVFAEKPNPAPKVIVIGFDGMDPVLTEQMMDAGQLPALDALRKKNGYRRLGTSNPPQSPVAWANFINGAGHLDFMVVFAGHIANKYELSPSRLAISLHFLIYKLHVPLIDIYILP